LQQQPTEQVVVAMNSAFFTEAMDKAKLVFKESTGVGGGGSDNGDGASATDEQPQQPDRLEELSEYCPKLTFQQVNYSDPCRSARVEAKPSRNVVTYCCFATPRALLAADKTMTCPTTHAARFIHAPSFVRPKPQRSSS